MEESVEVKSELPEAEAEAEVEEGAAPLAADATATTPPPPPSPSPPPPPPAPHGSATDVNDDEAATLAQLWPSRKSSKSDSQTTTPGKAKKTVEKTGSTLKTRKRRPKSTTKLTISLRSGKTQSHEKYTSSVDGSATPSVIKPAALVRAEELRSNLDQNFPSFIKSLVRSHVGSCFFMGLPGPICKAHLPQTDATVIVEDEHGKQYDVKYISQKTGLSAGWRQFSVEHNLLEGDVLVFQLVEASKLKVHIIKAIEDTEVEGDRRLLKLDSPAENLETGVEPAGLLASKPRKRRRPKSFPLSILQKKRKKPSQQKSLTSEVGRPAEQSGNDSEEVRSEVLESFKLSVPKVQFKDVASFEDFKILIDGVLVDSEFNEDIRQKYYDLCRSQNGFLHENFMEGVNLKLVVGMISEIVGISDAIRGCDLTTGRDKFTTWDRTLKAFELLGMNVGFLTARVERLTRLAFESGSSEEARKLAEAKSKRASAEEEIRKLELRLLELEEASQKFGAEIESLRPKVESYEVEFQEEVNAPW